MKISNLVEQIFSHAVALEQSGGLRNTIYAIGNEIYIMNYDHTVLLRFQLRKSEAPFEHPISFRADDYDSNTFEEKNGKIMFYSGNEAYDRKKTCGTTDLSPEEVKTLFERFIHDEGDRQTIRLNKQLVELLEPTLSHVEFEGKKGEGITMTQRNIYSGGVVEITQKKGGFFGGTLERSFGPIAIKTNDFIALFSFQDDLDYSFSNEGEEDFIVVTSIEKRKRDLSGVIACCIYDEIIKIKEVKNGGKIEKIRRRK